jgi:cytidylate kinase
MIVVIDGPAGTGKSTVARLVAKKLKFLFLDTGAMYRSVTYGLLKQEIALDDSEAIGRYLDTFDLQVQGTDDQITYLLDGEDITESIRSKQITAQVSRVSALAVVRDHLVPIQRKVIAGHDAVAEGRDLGTVVFPNAELKVFLTARPEVRAERRLKQNGEIAISKENLAAIQAEIEERDRYDSSREHSPLKLADDAIVIDTGDLTIDAVVDTILDLL